MPSQLSILKRNSRSLIFTPFRSYHSNSSSVLSSFISEYFHQYRFIVAGRLNIRKFSSKLFDATPVHDKDYKVINVEVTAKFDPTITLLSGIDQLGKNPMGFSISPTSDNWLSVISPTGWIPTHFALRFRDALEEQGHRTITDIADLQNKKRAKTVKDPFSFKLNFESIQNTAEQDEVNRIKAIIDGWSQLSSEKQKELIDEFYHAYYRSYCDSVMRFNVHDPKWNAYNGLNELSDPYNKASQFMALSHYRHSLVSPVFPGNISGGGFNMNHYCPGVKFLRGLGRKVDQNDVNVRNARSCIPYNGFIPYWMMIYLKETFDTLSLSTSPLEMPWEMSQVLDEICPSEKQDRRLTR